MIDIYAERQKAKQLIDVYREAAAQNIATVEGLSLPAHGDVHMMADGAFVEVMLLISRTHPIVVAAEKEHGN